MSKTLQTADAYRQIEESLETIRNTEPQSLANMEVYDEWRQGDLRIIRLPDNFVAENMDRLVEDKPQQQLVVGNTQGSQHCLDSVEGVKFFKFRDSNALDGPVIQSENVRNILHPTHGNCVDMPAGCYTFPGQKSLAEELRRAAD